MFEHSRTNHKRNADEIRPHLLSKYWQHLFMYNIEVERFYLRRWKWIKLRTGPDAWTHMLSLSLSESCWRNPMILRHLRWLRILFYVRASSAWRVGIIYITNFYPSLLHYGVYINFFCRFPKFYCRFMYICSFIRIVLTLQFIWMNIFIYDSKNSN